jgi:SAM-dependent methyltransferase
MGQEGHHSAWYDRFYADRGFLEAGPWYAGASRLLAEHEPDLSRKVILEVGCGAGAFLSLLDASKRIGVDPSLEACTLTRARGVASLMAAGESLPFGSGTVDVIVFCEVIEHVESPPAVLAEIERVLRDEGLVILSFPNYLNVPWLALRILAQVLRKPNWIELQPRNRIMTLLRVSRLIRSAGFRRVGMIGYVLEPPGVYHRRKKRGLPPIASRRLAFLCLHPVIALRRSGSAGRPLGRENPKSRNGG